ncbi:Ribose-phosphate pyrophosphokinase [uncultured archaeon]|nr:Ribose-phosphate pyrophosphokinase [uncultured archaeon]
MNSESSILLFSGKSNPGLASEVAKDLKIPLGKVELTKFADGETYVNYGETLRGRDVYIMQSTCNPQNDNLMEMLIMVDAAKRAAAQRITCVIPYYGYAKQDRKAHDREPITAKLIAKLIQSAGADAVLTMDLHADQIQGFFDIRADFLYASGVLTKYFLQKDLKDIMVVAPDVGSTKRARKYAKILGSDLAIIDKRRPKPNVSEVVNLIGDVSGKVCLIVDDEINTGGTIVNAAEALIKKGAKEVYVMASHAVFAGEAIGKIEKSSIKEIIVTNSIPARSESRKIKVVSVARLFADAIRCMHTNKSLSELLGR